MVAIVVPGVAFAGALQAEREARVLLLAVAACVTLVLAAGFSWRFFLTQVEISGGVLSVITPLGRKSWRIPEDVRGIEDAGSFHIVKVQNAAGRYSFCSGLFHAHESLKPINDLVSEARSRRP